jgi:ribosomal protein L11 methyltransferase
LWLLSIPSETHRRTKRFIRGDAEPMEYKALHFKLERISDSLKEIIIARLYSSGFEGFLETDDGFVAYIPADLYKRQNIDDICLSEDPAFRDMVIEEDFIIEKNWNELWEKSYEPVIVENICLIKAPFHKNTPSCQYEIIIEPKMSFGTGHHETTALMIKEMLETSFKGKKVLDMGCGTGVLAMLASMKGAASVTAIDINEWAYKNAVENAEKNGISNISVYKGDVSIAGCNTFDIIMANIQLSVILNDIKYYQPLLAPEGLLVLSGFLKPDLAKIKKQCFKYSLKYISFKEKNNWVSAKFKNIIK